MIGIDITPLLLGHRRGVARAVHQLLIAWHHNPPGPAVHPIAPGPLPGDVPRLAGAVRPDVPLDSHRGLREAMPLLVAEHDIRVLLSPWSAFPNLTIPIVAWIHEVPSVRHGWLEGAARTFSDRRWLRRNVEECAAVLVPSRATQKDLLALHPHAASLVHCIPNVFDPAPWRPAARVAPARPYALMVGVGAGRTGARKKGLDVLFKAWKRLPTPGLELVLVGDPALALPPSARVVARPEDKELRRLVAGASMLVYPSRSEGFGYPPLEAMAAGTPVIASDAGSIPEIVEEAALSVPSGDDVALGRAMRRLHGDDDLRRRLVHAGHRRAKAFLPERIAPRLETLLTDVAHRVGA